MELDKELVALNDLLKKVFTYGVKVGDDKSYTITDHIRDEKQIQDDVREALANLLEALGYNINNYQVYLEEDYGTRSCEWCYIAPQIELK